MEDEKRVETLEDEFKLIKGQLKETLSSVRDYLLTSELPASEYSTIMAALGVSGGGGGQMTMKGEITAPKKEDLPEPTKSEAKELVEEDEPFANESELAPEEELVEESDPFANESELAPEEELIERGEPFANQLGLAPEEEMVEGGEAFSSGSELTPEEEMLEEGEPFANESGLAPEEEMVEEGEPFANQSGLTPEEEMVEEGKPFSNESGFPEQRMEYENAGEEAGPSAPPVNLMANMIRWVSNAKREIGGEQLPIFLEVYGISGHLSPELKEVILYLADITVEQSAGANAAETWSRLISELHGILTGGDAPLHPVRPFWNDSGEEIKPGETQVETEADKPADKPIKLKLVLSDSEGNDKEFCINLNQDEIKESL